MIIKKFPEDFVVKEKINLSLNPLGEYSYFLMRKRGVTTIDAIKKVARFLKIDVKSINYAGTKDKQALTEQIISVWKCNKRSSAKLSDDLEIFYIGQGEDRINLGFLEGNYFKIMVRDLNKGELSRIKGKINLQCENYFDEQRFSKQNFDVGMAILKKDYKKAAELLGIGEENAINKITRMEKKIVLFFISSVQAYIFNEMLYNYVRENSRDFVEVDYTLGKLAFSRERLSNIKLPMVGFGTEVTEDLSSILEKLGLTPRDFVIRSIPGMSQEGYERDAFVETEIEAEIKENNAVLSFYLPKGSYATIVLKKIFA